MALVVLFVGFTASVAEASCEIITPTPTGYKKIIIQNDALCAKIKP